MHRRRPPARGEFNRSSQHRSDLRCCNMSLKQELIDKQARFWVLMAGGSTLTGASETVGVSRATGRKWRQATGGRIPRKRPEPSGRYLSLEERLQIADLYLAGPALGRLPSGSTARPRPSVVSCAATAPRQRPGGRGSTRRTR